MNFDLHTVGEYVYAAIRDGSLENYSAHQQTTRAQHRALIVAPTYFSNPNWPELLDAAVNVVLIHQMLVRIGYEKKNIRVLCDICGGFSGASYPTRMNILRAMDWLTKDTRSGDSRFCYFSGYGEQGNPAGILQPQQFQVGKRYSTSGGGGWSDLETLAMPYYNEVFVAKHQAVDFETREGLISKVLAVELNRYLARLSPGVMSTCILDYIAGEKRVPDRNKEAPVQNYRYCSPAAEPMHTDQSSQLGVTQASAQGCKCHPRPSIYSGTAQYKTSGLVVGQDTLCGDRGHGETNEEREMVVLRAITCLWTGLHQRAKRDNTGTLAPGRFVKAFTEATEGYRDVLELHSNNQTLFHRVSEKIQPTFLPDQSVQFVHLWTPPPVDDESQMEEAA
ncbi:ICE-like protease (caspase) p20 domain protein [Ceratobasidium sp. AG-Ba]|nr:ICE-like protease (caspase) p20 domain protein [Ceratobasidium sp. AG-Ba]